MSTETAEIRTAAEDDLDAVCAFGARFIPAFYAPLLGDEPARSQAARWWSHDEMRPAVLDGCVVVAVRDDLVVGVAQFDPTMLPPMIWKLYVDPALRGGGLGPRLLDAVFAMLPADTATVGIEHFTVNERAARFYEREGFALDRIEDAASGNPREAVSWRVKQLR